MTHIFKHREALLRIVIECADEAVDKIMEIGCFTRGNIKYLPGILADFAKVFTGYIMEANDKRINDSKELDEILRGVGRVIAEHLNEDVWEDIDVDTLCTWIAMMQTEIFWHFYPNTKVEELI